MGVSNENKYLSHDGLSTVWTKVKEYTDDKARKLINITYNELRKLRDDEGLFPGRQYRITDYVTTTIQTDTVSAEHKFDIIVTADSENTLNENARAILHNDDMYFENCNLAAWELKYSLDNSAKYSWAAPDNGEIHMAMLCMLGYSGQPIRVSSADMKVDNIDYYCWKLDKNDFHIYTDTLEPTRETTVFTPEFINYDSGKLVYEMVVVEGAYFEDTVINVTPGKGVIYYMKDEWGNELPYDFKNIIFNKGVKDVKLLIEYDYNNRFQNKTAELVYSDDRDIVIYNDILEKDIKYYAWRVFDTDGRASGICYTQDAYDCITSSTVFFEYIPPTEEEIKAYIEQMSLVEGISEGIGGDKPLIGVFAELTNIRLIDIMKNLKQYTFGDTYGAIESLTDYSLNTIGTKSVKNNIMKPLIVNGKYTLNGNVFTGANNNIVLNNCPKIDKSSITYETVKDIKNTDDTEFSKVYNSSNDKSEAMESYEMGFQDVKSACLDALGYGYGSGGSGGSGSSFVVNIPTGDFHYDTYLTPMEVAFANANGDKLITNNLSTVPADYEPIGVVVIPASHDVYGTGECGVVSLKYMDPDNPDEGCFDGVRMGNSAYGNGHPHLISIGYNDYYYSEAQYEIYEGDLPTDLQSGLLSLDGETHYYERASELIPSPYNPDGTRNQLYADGRTAISDFNGKENSQKLIDAIEASDWKVIDKIPYISFTTYYQYIYDYSPAAACCWRYHTIGTNQGDWYQPALGEACYAINRKGALENTLNIISKYFNTNNIRIIYTICTSSFYHYLGSPYYWYVNFDGLIDQYDNYYVLAFTRIKP